MCNAPRPYRKFSLQHGIKAVHFVAVTGIGEKANHLLQIYLNPLNAKLNPICHLLLLLVAHLILHVSRIRVNGVLVTVLMA